MNCSHHPEHDAWLAAVLAGDPGADAFVAELEACPTCGARLSKLREMTEALDAVGAEQRAILAGPGETGAGDADLVGRALAAGLAGRRAAPQRRARGPGLWRLAAAAMLGVLLGWSMLSDPPDEEPKDQVLNSGEAWPADVLIGVDELIERGFAWAGHEAETYELLLFRPSDPLDPWRRLESTGPMLRPDRQLVEDMRRVSKIWYWQYERTSPAMPDTPSVEVGGLVQFEFLP